MPQLLFREQWSGQFLSRDYPPLFSNRNKALLYQLAGGRGAEGEGSIGVSRWAAVSAITALNWAGPLRLSAVPGFYRYEPVEDPGRMEWHVNFADAQLFGFYGGSLFAQDEMQVAEHPLLASVREKLCALSQRDQRYAPRTRDLRDLPTPVLLTGVERRLAIDTCPNGAAGRPDGLYGNHMARATDHVLASATHKLEPPTRTQLLAIAAPRGGVGDYTRTQISDALYTALTGFAAVRAESSFSCLVTSNLAGVDCFAIHTGMWGCGAFGGNAVLMLVVQMLAGLWAGIDELVFHDVQPEAWELAHGHYRQLQECRSDFYGVVDFLLARKFRWGVSNGT